MLLHSPPLTPPAAELDRSPAARWVGDQAERMGLIVSQFESWEPPPSPDHWLPKARPDLVEAPRWHQGILMEGKYQAHTHDRRIASYHSGYRAKWTAHEYLHGMVGFAWNDQASDFFHALAAWQAEILPVAVWYFHDEYALRRCPDHQGGGPLFRTFCPACEEAARQGGLAENPAERERWYGPGRDFVETQLEGVRQSVQTGRFEARPWASLDLASDGLAYAQAQSGRLSSEAFGRFMDLYPPPALSLDGFEHRIMTALDALENETDFAEPTAAKHWIARDLCWRLLSLWSDCEGEAATELLSLAERQAQGSEQSAEILSAYRNLYEEWYLPEPEQIFAVGYSLGLDGLGRSVARIRSGLASVCPVTLEQVGENLIEDFVVQDSLERLPLIQRFADYLESLDGDSALQDLLVQEWQASGSTSGGQ